MKEPYVVLYHVWEIILSSIHNMQVLRKHNHFITACSAFLTTLNNDHKNLWVINHNKEYTLNAHCFT